MTNDMHNSLPHDARVREQYDYQVRHGVISSDDRQLRIVDELDELLLQIKHRRMQRKSSALGWLFARNKPKMEPLKGLYIYGGVGRGKTMLMDIFFNAAPIERKKRIHFNEFMNDVHKRINMHRASVHAGTAAQNDPIPPVADAIIGESWLICFDEFSVTDITDAMILSRLFTALFDRGAILVATSNVAPNDLYRDGLNRSLFLPFIDILSRNTKIMPLDHETDYRLLKLSAMKAYHTPNDASAKQAMDETWALICAQKIEGSKEITNKGRVIIAPRVSGKSARFSFRELCEQPLSASDYIALCDEFNCFFIEDVPIMDVSERNSAKRFILLVDTLYDRHCQLYICAEATPDALYIGQSGTEKFEFDRTASRLIEMQSTQYLKDCNS